MKNTIILLFLFSSSVTYSEIKPVHMTLHEKYYENWLGFQIDNIFQKYYDAIMRDHVNIYADSMCKVQLLKEEVSKLMSYDHKMLYPDDPTDPFGPGRDTVIHKVLSKDWYTNKFACVHNGNELYAIGIYIFDFRLDEHNPVISKQPAFYIKWEDLKSKLDSEENFALNTMLEYKYHKFKLSNIIEISDAKALSMPMHWSIESKLYKNVVNVKVPSYDNDSFITKNTKEDIDYRLSDERIVTMANDESNPYGPSHDSIIKMYPIRDDIDNDTGRGWDMYLLWGAQKGVSVKLIAISPAFDKTVNGTPVGHLLIGYVKESDFKMIYNKEEEQLLNYVALYTLYLNIDYKGMNSGHDTGFDYNRLPPFPYWKR